ncbi:MAG: molecular chaperone HtpG [Bacteroidia bacterium]
MSKKGTLQVHTENIFPIIKKFLYSDHEIFLRELVSNAVDATQKVKMLAQKGELNSELGETRITVKADKDKKTLTISDNGIGMSEEEVEKYINQIAFSSAEEFVEKFKDLDDKSAIIGHFGLGFYSAFMIANKVELVTKSHSDAPAVKWSCVGTTDFEMEETTRENRGTDVILHVNEGEEDFLEDNKIKDLLKKYCKFMPVEIAYGDEDPINKTDPLWLKQPSDIKEEEYNEFYKDLFPFQPDPLFNIHLNVDYPFNLTGILYFPKVDNSLALDKNKIHLYSNQVFVTDKVTDIVPEFLTLLHGVIDSPDIPLNVSRSYLQADGNVKKISNYIVRKVADKLDSLFKEDRKAFEEKWEDIGVFVKYGMLTEDKFFEKAKKFFLIKNTNGEFATLEEYKEKVKVAQTDKDDKLVYLYTSNADMHNSQIAQANERGYDVAVFDHPIDSHLIQKIESTEEGLSVKRIDAAPISELIDKDEKAEEVLSKKEVEKVIEAYKGLVEEATYKVENKPLSPQDPPVMITQDEFMRRMKEMQAMGGGGMMGMGGFPDTYNLVVNTNHEISRKIAGMDGDEQGKLAQYAVDLAKLSNGLLTGAELTNFVNRSLDMVK